MRIVEEKMLAGGDSTTWKEGRGSRPGRSGIVLLMDILIGRIFRVEGKSFWMEILFV